MGNRAVLASLAFALMVGPWGCQCLSAPSGVLYQCDDRGVCPAGYQCGGGYCFPLDAGAAPDSGPPDSGAPDATPEDAAIPDAAPADAALPRPDAGSNADSGVGPDAATVDSGATPPDAGGVDAGCSKASDCPSFQACQPNIQVCGPQCGQGTVVCNGGCCDTQSLCSDGLTSGACGLNGLGCAICGNNQTCAGGSCINVDAGVDSGVSGCVPDQFMVSACVGGGGCCFTCENMGTTGRCCSAVGQVCNVNADCCIAMVSGTPLCQNNTCCLASGGGCSLNSACCSAQCVAGICA